MLSPWYNVTCAKAAAAGKSDKAMGITKRNNVNWFFFIARPSLLIGFLLSGGPNKIPLPAALRLRCRFAGCFCSVRRLWRRGHQVNSINGQNKVRVILSQGQEPFPE